LCVRWPADPSSCCTEIAGRGCTGSRDRPVRSATAPRPSPLVSDDESQQSRDHKQAGRGSVVELSPQPTHISPLAGSDKPSWPPRLSLVIGIGRRVLAHLVGPLTVGLRAHRPNPHSWLKLVACRFKRFMAPPQLKAVGSEPSSTTDASPADNPEAPPVDEDGVIPFVSSSPHQESEPAAGDDNDPQFRRS
jgi:hypothetical protein